jgi:hypothetical protein
MKAVHFREVVGGTSGSTSSLPPRVVVGFLSGEESGKSPARKCKSARVYRWREWKAVLRCPFEEANTVELFCVRWNGTKHVG